MPADPAAFDALATPVAWLDGSMRIEGANPAFGRWLGVGLRRLGGLPLGALEPDGDVLHGLAANPPAMTAIRRITTTRLRAGPRSQRGW